MFHGLIYSLIFKSQKDSLMEMSFHIPNSNTQFVGDETRPPAQVSCSFYSTMFFVLISVTCLS